MEPSESIVISSQVVSDGGDLALNLDALPLDLGLSQLLNTDDKHVVLSDGQVVKLTGTDDDILAVTRDFNFRSRHMVINAYASGVNLLRLRDYLVNTCGYSQKQFWEKVTALTEYSKGPLEKRIKMAEGYTQEQMQRLAVAGLTQTTAVLLLKASPEKREEVLAEAEQGIQLSKAVVNEIIGEPEGDDEDEDEDEADSEDEDKKAPAKSKKGSSGGGGGGGSRSAANTQATSSASTKTGKSVEMQPATDVTIDVAGSFTNYADLITDVKDFTPQSVTLEQRFNNLVRAIETARTKHELSTVRGLAVRGVTTDFLTAVFGIEVPPEIETEGEPEWVKALRDKLPKSVNKQFKPIYVMAFVDGHLGAINGEKAAPTAYEGLIKGKTLKREGVDCLYELWAEGFAQGKQRLALEEAQKADA